MKTSDKFLQVQGLCIAYFKISPKNAYGHGHYNCRLTLNDASTIETIPPIFKVYNFLPTTKLNQLKTMNNVFAIGTLVTSTRKIGSQYALNLKDGNIEEHRFVVSTKLNTIYR